MSFATNSAFLMMHTAGLSNNQFKVQQSNQARMSLANNDAMSVAMSPNPYSSGAMRSLQQADLGYQLDAIRAGFAAKALSAMIESTQKMLKEDVKSFSTFG